MNNTATDNMDNDPLCPRNFKGPSFLEKLLGGVFGLERPFDCAQIEVTSACVGACVYCPHTAQAGYWHSRHLPPDIFAKLWPLLLKTKRAHLQGWGEPLLNPRFFDFQALAAKAGCLTSTTSCGMAMGEEKAEKLANSGMDLIAFSLVGTDEASNSPRAKVPFEQVCQSVATLRQAIDASEQAQPLEIHFAYLLLADRLDAVKKLPELMDRLNVEMAVISTLDYLAAPAHRELAFHPEDRDLIEKAREILQEAKAKADSYGRIIHFALPGHKQAEEGCRENIGKCVYIAANGDISPCVYLNVPGNDPEEKRRVFGNIANQNPLETWNNPYFKSFRANLLAGKPEDVCLNCPKRMEENG